MLTVFGVISLTFMMGMYALERRGPAFVLAFAFGCALSSAYGFASGAWPFGAVEAVWCAIAVRRFATTRAEVPGAEGSRRDPPKSPGSPPG
jgi:hypothetical protein